MSSRVWIVGPIAWDTVIYLPSMPKPGKFVQAIQTIPEQLLVFSQQVLQMQQSHLQQQELKQDLSAISAMNTSVHNCVRL